MVHKDKLLALLVSMYSPRHTSNPQCASRLLTSMEHRAPDSSTYRRRHLRYLDTHWAPLLIYSIYSYVIIRAGYYAPGSGQATCKPCDMGTYMPNLGASECTPCAAGCILAPCNSLPASMYRCALSVRSAVVLFFFYFRKIIIAEQDKHLPLFAKLVLLELQLMVNRARPLAICVMLVLIRYCFCDLMCALACFAHYCR